MCGLVVVNWRAYKYQTAFYIVARDLAKILNLPMVGLNKTVYPFIATTRPDLVINMGTFSAQILLTRLAALTAMARRVIAYSAVEGIPTKMKLISNLANLATRSHKLSIVVPSKYVKTELQSVGIKVEAVIPHGVDFKEIDSVAESKTTFALPHSKNKVLSVFSSLFQLRKRLGLFYLLRAWSKLPQDTRRNACLVLKVPKGTGQLVNEFATSLKLRKGEYVVLDTWFSRDSLFCLFKAANIYVHGALADAFGIPLVESLACGTPVIALDGPPWNEIINEKLGWMVKISRESIVQNLGLFTPMHRLRLPEVTDLSLKIAEAIRFCEVTDYEHLRKRCLDYARAFDVHRTYEKFKELIDD